MLGWAFRETSGSAGAVFDIYDGAAGSGPGVLVPIDLNSGQSTRDWFSIHPMPFYSGITIANLTGAVTGVVWVSVTDPDEPWSIPIVATIPLGLPGLPFGP